MSPPLPRPEPTPGVSALLALEPSLVKVGGKRAGERLITGRRRPTRGTVWPWVEVDVDGEAGNDREVRGRRGRRRAPPGRLRGRVAGGQGQAPAGAVLPERLAPRRRGHRPGGRGACPHPGTRFRLPGGPREVGMASGVEPSHRRSAPPAAPRRQPGP